jgi:phospholipid/cholesterol/gamma-HCH transport system permease protein
VTLDECGPGALSIVTLISVLVGVILGFIGAQQLRQFGAEIYVANLVGIAMVREMGAIMAGIIMAGRTGAAFAAQLGTMQVNEEIDALKTFGFSPMEYLVVPRIVALIIMMPLLCIYADVLGMAGGALISALALDISLERYFQQLITAVLLKDILIGVAKSAVFGILIACAGCLCGMRCGRSASAVGIAVTSAVVSGIVAIVISDAVFAAVCEALGI